MKNKKKIQLREKLESIYLRYNKKEYIDPDPLLFLYDFPDKKNREIAGFIAACLAYGRVDMIMKTVGSVLKKLKPSPFDYLQSRQKKDIENDFKDFQYRFASSDHLVSLLFGMKQVLKSFDSLEECFFTGISHEDETIMSGLVYFYEQIKKTSNLDHLLADPKKNSACKRSHLFLRWMVRNDKVDPGGWGNIDPAKLIIPLDTHMYKAGIMLGFTLRKSRDIKTAMEITQGFKKIMPQDPVKYDFCLTRYGIRKELKMDSLSEFLASDKKVIS